MTHLGDITKISGYDAPVVDCIIGGSPCQDLSTAGKRAGLAGARSGLFMEQIRIVKEMRENERKHGRAARPRFMVWENVPGALSSNKGEDFGAVLDEIIRVAEPAAPAVSRPKKWPLADAYIGDGWSIAYRILDAQFWGVPQRRRRIALVADFGGHAAPEILFIRKSVCGDTAESGGAGQGVTGGAADGVNPAVARSLTARHDGSPCFDRGPNIVMQEIAHALKAKANLSFREDSDTLICTPEIMQTLDTMTDKQKFCVAFSGGQGAKAGGLGLAEECAPSLKAADSGSNRTPCICIAGNTIDRQPHNGGNGVGAQEEIAYTLTSADRHAVYDARGNGNGETVPTLTVDHQRTISDYTALAVLPFDTTQITSPQNRSNPHYGDPCHPLAVRAHAPAVAVDCRNLRVTDECGTLQAKANGGQSLDYINPVLCMAHGQANAEITENVSPTLNCNHEQPIIGTQIVRRLTPLECERLQGYPDGWTDIGAWTDSKGKLHKESSDSARYKALGNSIALPPWRWVLKRLCACYERDATMASLFDGIGGFPLIWEQFNGRGSCLWASEIEEFPLAVTRARFG